MTEAALQQYIQAIRPADRAVMDAARERQAELAKPPGSLGRLEDYAVRLAEQGKVDIGQRALLDRLVWTTHGDTLALALIANNLRWSQHRHGLARLMSDLDGVGLVNDERDAASRPMRELRRCVATQAATSTPEPTACATQLRMAATGALADGFGARAQRD